MSLNVFGRLNEFLSVSIESVSPPPPPAPPPPPPFYLVDWIARRADESVLRPCMCVRMCVCECRRGLRVTLNHNGTALKLIQQLWVSHDHTMMPVVPLASPLSGTTVCVHKFEREAREPSLRLLLGRGADH